MLKYFFFTAFFTITTNCFCQKNKTVIDSLEKKVTQPLQDTNKVKDLVTLAIEYAKVDSAKAIKNITAALNLALKLKYPQGQIDAYNNLGIFYMNFSDNEKSLKHFKQAETTIISFNQLPKLESLYSNMGNLYSDWNKSREAIEYYNKSIELAIRYKNKKGESITYNNLGTEYIQNGNLEKATEYLLKSLAIREQISDKKGEANVSSNLSVLYKELKKYDEAFFYGKNAIKIFKSLGLKIDEGRVQVNLGLIANRKKEYANAENYFDAALALFKGTTYTRGLAAVYNNRGLVLKNQNKTEDAYKNYIASYELSISMKDRQGEAISLIELGDLAMMKMDYADAETKLLAALKIANEINYLELQKDANETLSNLHKEKGEYQKAYTYQSAFRDLNDSIIGKEKIKIIEDVKGKYETEKKELSINLLSKSDSIKGLKILGQELAIRNNLLKIADQNLALTEADLQLTEDSLTIKTNNEIILKNKLDAQQKEEKISLLAKQKRIQELEVNKKNNTIIALGIGILLIAFAGFAFYKQRTAQQQAKLQLAVAKEQDIAMQGIIEAEEKERQRIAVELHDGVGQVMTAAWLNLNALKNEIAFTTDTQANLFNTSLELVDGGCKEVRSVSHNMMPNALVKKGLINAVREFIQQINTNKLSINLQTNGLNNPLPNHIETVLYRVIQESVNNVVKHANASNLEISINQEVDGVDVIIEDNGIGFNTKTPRDTDGIGLMNIKNRVQYLKGAVEWNSEPNKGTAVAIYIPVENANS